MALYKQVKSQYWWLDFQFEGRRHQVSTKCRNKRDAEKFAAAYKTQLANDKVDLKPRKRIITFSTAMADFLAWSKVQQKESTYTRYVTSSKALLRFFANKSVSEIDREHLEKYVSWRSKQKKKAPALKLIKTPSAITSKPIQPATINREVACLRMLLNRLLDLGTISKNPAARYSSLPEDSDAMRVISDAEERIYLMACSQPLRDVAIVMLNTGMRPSEIFELKKKDINFDQSLLMVKHGKTKAARRRLHMSDEVTAIMKTRCATAPGSYVFAGGLDGKSEEPIVKLTNAHKAAIARCGLEAFRLYDLRHTFATRASEAGVDLITLKDILGHSRLDMVLRYAHPTEVHRIDAMKMLAARKLKKAV